MYDQLAESKTIQCLTNYFSTTFSVIEYHAFPAKFNHHYLENASQRISNRKFCINFDNSPFSLLIMQRNRSYMDRFYMRIIEFLQYRLNIFKGIESSVHLIKIINNFISNLNRFFKNIEWKDNQMTFKYITVGQIFIEIQQFVAKLVQDIFQYLKNNNIKSSLVLDQIYFSNKIINQHILAPFYNLLEETYQENQTFKFQEPLFRNQIYHHDFDADDALRSKIRPYSDMKMENFHSMNFKSFRSNKLQSKCRVDLKTSEANRNSEISKKQQYIQLISIMDIEDIQVYSRDYILNQLKANNIKNKEIISKYLKTYTKKKQRRKKKIIQLEQKVGNKTDCQDDSAIKIKLNQKHRVNFESKSKSQVQAALKLDKINSYKNQQELETQKSSQSNNLKSQKFPKSTSTNSIGNDLCFFSSTSGSKSQSKSIQKQFIKKSIYKNSSFQLGQDTFAFKDSQKIYFQSLKNKLHFQSEKMADKPPIIKKQSQNQFKASSILTLKTIEPVSRDRLFYLNNIKKNAPKQQNVVNANQKAKSLNSDRFINDDIASMDAISLASLEQLSLKRRIPVRGKLLKFEQNENLTKNRPDPNMNKKLQKKQHIYIENESSVLVLPRISQTSKHLNPDK